MRTWDAVALVQCVHAVSLIILRKGIGSQWLAFHLKGFMHIFEVSHWQKGQCKHRKLRKKIIKSAKKFSVSWLVQKRAKCASFSICSTGCGRVAVQRVANSNIKLYVAMATNYFHLYCHLLTNPGWFVHLMEKHFVFFSFFFWGNVQKISFTSRWNPGHSALNAFQVHSHFYCQVRRWPAPAL